MLSRHEVIAELNTETERLLNIHYPQDELPEWVDKRLFWISYGKRILGSAISSFVCCYDDLKEDGTLKVDVDRQLLAFALVSMEFEEPDDDEDIIVGDYSFTFSKQVVEFLLNAMGDPPKTKKGWMSVESKIRETVGLVAVNKKWL